MAHYPLYPELEAWLEQRHAWRVGEGQVGEQHHDLYAVNGRLLIVALYSDDQGFDIFIPIPHKNSMTDALKAAEIAFGIQSS
jgi:hypothetical protein